MPNTSLWVEANRYAANIAGTTGEKRSEAISAFLRAAMVALLVG